MKIHLIAAARPNFMKIAPLFHALKKESWAEPVIVHTGQHYDVNMSDVFFQNLGLSVPDTNLGAGSGSHAEQTGQVMIAYEKKLLTDKPDLVVVVGDVNSTMAATLAAVKTGFKVAHLEAGLRSFDRTMPEEINRLITDALADILWTPSSDADENLAHEGIPAHKIHRVGNIMIDSLEMLRDKIETEKEYEKLGLTKGAYGLVTLHRPSNVDNPAILKSFCRSLIKLTSKIPFVFPIHPRTSKNIENNGYSDMMRQAEGLIVLSPLSYIRFMNLVFNSRIVITDSGGIQEETTYLGIPCITLRSNTERPITVTQGTNRLSNLEELEQKVVSILEGPERTICRIENWDGHTADRVVMIIRRIFEV